MSYAREPMQEELFLAKKRDAQLNQKSYATQLRREINSFELVTSRLANLSDLNPPAADRPMMAARRRAWNAVRYLHLQYSAGEEITELGKFLPTGVRYWAEYSDYHVSFHHTSESHYIKAHITLGDGEYWDAIRLTSWAVLLGCPQLLPDLCSIWDYGNQPLDGLLERLVAPYVSGRAPPPDKCTRHLPYAKLIRVFAAEPYKRPALMAKYLDDWYEASRREPYYRSHTAGREHSYLRYWSFEAAAVTIVLGIDDSIYRDKDFYPRDLADFARGIDLQAGDDVSTSTRTLAFAPTNV